MATRRVIGTWRSFGDQTRAPVSGAITFRPTVLVRDKATGHIVVQNPVVVQLDSFGSIDIQLQVTSDPNLEPEGWQWEVTEQITSRTARRYPILIPAGNSSFDLSQVEVPPSAVFLDPQSLYLKGVQVGATTVRNPNQAPTVDVTSANSIATLKFQLPRAGAPAVGDVTVGTPAQGPAVTSSSTADGDPRFNFRLPRSRNVSTPSLTVLDPDQPPAVATTQNSDGDLSINFSLPRAAAFEVGDVSGGTDASDAQVTDVGVDGDVKLDFVLPRPTVNVGTTTTVNPDQNPDVSNSGTDAAVVLDFDLPAAPTFTVGDVTTVGPSTPASTTDVGSDGNIVLDFALPRGEKGWASALNIVTDGARRVLQVDDWVGGEGTKPATGDYVGATGLVSDIALAVDIRGAQGPSGTGALSDLSDVSIVTPLAGQIIQYDDATSNWLNVTPDTDDIAEGATNLYYTDGRVEAVIAASDTDDLAEGAVNLYYTDGRVDAVIAASDTDDLAEGPTNLYYTDARVDAVIAASDTDDLAEGPTNLYFTDQRADDRADGRIAAADIDDLADVTVTTPQDGDILVYQSGDWVNQAPESPIGLIIALGG